ncbi:MAG: hypothetical protein D6766_00155 [Verrucomicrobia bacterium]|nr:MAG: hypothetical protein D6766_00155 [Verrucomicrobiota bacterium]
MLIASFTVLFGLLIYWLLGFVMRDLGTWPGPAYEVLEKQMLDKALVTESQQVESSLAETQQTIEDLRRQQQALRDSAANAERTMNQLLELQRLSLQQGVKPTESEQEALAKSEQLFLATQEQVQQISEQIARLTEQQRTLEGRKRDLDARLQKARKEVRAAYQDQLTRHNLKLAALKLAVLLPLVILAVWLALKRRGALYAPMIHAFGLAVLAKVLMVMHEHFPSRFFKYILVGVSLLVVARILVHLIRMVAFPKTDWLLKQYREAYEHHLCPICSFPIRRGPLKYLAWTRRSIRKLAARIEPANETAPEEPYVCPLCGVTLFEECPECRAVRHALLPACWKCGAEKPVESPAASRVSQPNK